MLTAAELEAATEVKTLLRPLATVTAEVSADRTVSISKVIPLTQHIKTVSIFIYKIVANTLLIKNFDMFFFSFSESL